MYIAPISWNENVHLQIISVLQAAVKAQTGPLIIQELLQAISSGIPNNLAINLAKRCVELYPWYYMSAYVHKVLIHGKYYIRSNPIYE